ncbi:MAG: methylmalonyl Co-A mutase-associated GTPase MeaB [Rhodocyclaceae bacterium]|jgi:LAO/AO transport system kinase|nr:methylmalonyl Co-A mutase-associated GTPase MeaB [Rhodocyclaceae bacterium]
MAAVVPSLELVDRVCAGEINAIARLLTRAEAGSAECRPALDEIYRRAGRAHVVGITGVPGSGKSTLVARLAREIRASGRKVAIVAIDPSSPFTGGSILGDRIRMNDLAGDPGIFVRSMATRGALGGLARGTLEAVDILDAAGFDMVIVETVGVGQDEVDIVRASHTTVVMSAPGLGDDIQAIKAGVLEIADIHVVSKCDRPDANKTLIDLKAMLIMGLALARVPGWKVPVLATSSARGEGVAELFDAIVRHRAALEAEGGIDMRRRMIAERRLLKAAEGIIADRFEQHRGGRIADLLGNVMGRQTSPYAAAVELLNEIGMED